MLLHRTTRSINSGHILRRYCSGPERANDLINKSPTQNDHNMISKIKCPIDDINKTLKHIDNNQITISEIKKEIKDAVDNINNSSYWKTFLIIAVIYFYKNDISYQLGQIQNDINDLKRKQKT
uniref:Uncharacterized protein n=1 Tax=viral metagenome TaxID=1070528 RepID=A0A6C0C9B5_9ZZZZ